MSQHLKIKKQEILSDPVAIFSSQHPGADTDKKTKLGELWEQMQSLKMQHQKIQLQTNVISRQIGDAKRNNQSANNLIQSMQEYSLQRKQLETMLDDVEKQILDFFAADNDKSGHAGAQPNTEIAALSANRQYAVSFDNIDEVTVSLLNDEHAALNAYVSEHPAATIHHRTEWRDLFDKTYGLESFYFFAHDNNNKIVGILPLTRLKSRLFGDMLVSMPYFQRGGAVADHPLIEQKLMQAANDQAVRLGVEHIEYRDDILRENLPTQSHKVNMVLSLPDSEETLWQRFTPKLRAQIKRAQRTTPQVLIGGKEHLDDFYKVYIRNMRDLGSPAHSKSLVENILDSFPDNSWIIVLRLNNEPVSAGLLLGHGVTMEIPLASTLRKVNLLSINMLLYWEVLKLALRQGYTAFDFGRSSKGAGTYRFKQQWGAQPKQLYWHYWLSSAGKLPSLNPLNPKYALIVNIWKQLPIILTKWLGPLIVKNIP